ncbi:MAG TPA: hypothetical protein VFS08_13230 [Gemmatimonadaceae bacterium]|nr:hypothetical protein [Gemmatimonadaceae bacterium]
MHGARALRLAAPLLLTGCVGGPTPTATPATGAPAAPSAAPGGAACAAQDSTQRLRFVSSFWLNLHNALYRDARRQRGRTDESLGARGSVPHDTAAQRALTDDERARWQRAVAYYERSIVGDELGDSLVTRVNDRLAAAAPDRSLSDDALPAALRAALLDAAPIYRDVWWPVHDRHNAAWIDRARAQYASRGRCEGDTLAAALGTTWTTEPIRVDATVYASWFGAYTTLAPPHVTISSTAVGSNGATMLEVLLHEAGHVHLHAVDSALAAEAARQRRVLPAELSHLVLFYTTGALRRRADPTYVPYAERFGIWTKSRTARRHRGLLAREWQPWLDGRRSFAAAITGVVAGLPRR